MPWPQFILSALQTRNNDLHFLSTGAMPPCNNLHNHVCTSTCTQIVGTGGCGECVQQDAISRYGHWDRLDDNGTCAMWVGAACTGTISTNGTGSCAARPHYFCGGY